MKCNRCESEHIAYTVRLIPTNQFYPKYVPQIKANCMVCNKFIKFVKQTPELIKKLNEHLMDNELIEHVDIGFGDLTD